MKLIVINTGSKGNSYILSTSDGEKLLLEAGINPRKVLKGMDYDVANVKGLLVTHAHL